MYKKILDKDMPFGEMPNLIDNLAAKIDNISQENSELLRYIEKNKELKSKILELEYLNRS